MMEKQNVTSGNNIKIVYEELTEGISLPKCQKCGCMMETLENIETNFKSIPDSKLIGLTKAIDGWKKQMQPIKYSCLGCAHCYPAVAMNLLNEAFPENANTLQLDCSFDVEDEKWPYVDGEYYAFCGGDYCPVSVSTLGDTKLADKLAKIHPDELCIVGKTETENIGIDKVIKNTITNPTIKYLLLVGTEPKGHKSGETFIALDKNGVDDKMKVIGSTGKRPILRNVSNVEINSFRKQVEVVDMIGCSDENLIVQKIKELAFKKKSTCGCENCEDEQVDVKFATMEVLQAQEPSNIIMDKAGYFVILPIPKKHIINVEHYSYDNTLLRVVEGKDARSIYRTLIKNNWVRLLSHAAYLGKELEKAELSMDLGTKYVQDGA